MTSKTKLKSERYKGQKIDFYSFNTGYGHEVKSYVNNLPIVLYANTKEIAFKRTKEAIDDGAHKRSFKGY